MWLEGLSWAWIHSLLIRRYPFRSLVYQRTRVSSAAYLSPRWCGGFKRGSLNWKWPGSSHQSTMSLRPRWWGCCRVSEFYLPYDHNILPLTPQLESLVVIQIRLMRFWSAQAPIIEGTWRLPEQYRLLGLSLVVNVNKSSIFLKVWRRDVLDITVCSA